MEDISNYEKIKTDSNRFYDQIGKVGCAVFGQDVFFTSEGFNHLVYKNDRRERDRKVQIIKFKLLPLAQKLLKITTTFQEYEERLQEFRVKKFKVVVRKVGDNGQLNFWSVIPAWITNYHRDIKLISTMKGNPTDD